MRQIRRICFIVAIAFLTTLVVSAEPIQPVSSVPTLANFRGMGLEDSDLPNLVIEEGIISVDLSENNFTDLSGLNKFPTTVVLFSANTNKISNLAGLNFLTDNVKTIQLFDNLIFDLTNVTFPENLDRLNLTDNAIDTLEGVIFNENLKSISLGLNPFRGAALATTSVLPDGLKTLSLSANAIRDPSAIVLPEGLDRLFLDSNLLTDLSGLKLNSNLRKLDLSDNSFENVDLPTLTLPDSIRRLDLSDNFYSEFRGLKLPKKIKKVTLSKRFLSISEQKRILRKFRNRRVKFSFK